MGSICGPTIANLYVYCYERVWLSIHRPLFYVRYIDDIFIIVNNLQALESLRVSFGNLRLNLVHDKEVNFLDLRIYLDKITNFLVFSLYVKPTNTFCYLSVSSNHPEFIFENLPKSLFIRLRRICSYSYDFIKHSLKLTFQLLDRGYKLKHINKVFNMVFDLDRNKLLEYKDRNLRDNKVLNFIMEFDRNSTDFKNVFSRAFESFTNRYESFKDFKFRIINSTQRNLSSLLIHNFGFPDSLNCRYKKCSDFNCQTCNYANTSSLITLKNGYNLPIWDNSSCNSLNCVYIIYCKFCNKFYIGQTNNLKKRIYKHLYDIKKFKPFSYNSTSISIHFNLKYHIFQDHFSFFIYRNNLQDQFRLNLENFLINLFLKLDLQLINDFIPCIKNIYSCN